MMLNRIYYWLHSLTSNPKERNQYSSGYWQDRIRREALFLCRDLRGRVIEIGCGEGLFLAQIARQNLDLEIWGIDNNSKRLKLAEQRIKEANLRNINLSLQDATNLSLDDEYFDVVICINVFFNMDSIDFVKQALIHMKRICKKSGRIIFDFRNSWNPLLWIKYGLAQYYDETVKNLPLRCYNPKQIESILKDLSLKVVSKIFIPHLFNKGAGFIGSHIFKRFAPVIIIEAEKEKI